MQPQWKNRPRGVVARLTGVLWLVLVLQVGETGAAVAAGPFAGFSGSWAGSGQVTFKNGSTEQIRCRARYTTSNGDNALEQTLRCASASYQFELNTDIAHANGRISGSWVESTNDVAGRISGEASDGRIRALVSGDGLSASVAVTMSANVQAVRMRPQDQKVREVSIELRKN